jgi:hypothetical protein
MCGTSAPGAYGTGGGGAGTVNLDEHPVPLQESKAEREDGTVAVADSTYDGGTARRAFLTRWVGWATLGESLGFLAPVLAWFLAATAWPRAEFALLVLAGLAEGAVLGWFQVRVLRNRLPGISAARWVLLTAVAAAFAWSVGMLPSTFGEWQDWPLPLRLTAGGAAAILLLGSIGTAQWFELRHHVRRAWPWIAGNAAAWAAGLAAFMLVAPPLWQPDQPAWLIAVIGVGAAVLMAAVMAVVTGLVLLRLMPDAAAAGDAH